MVLLKLKKLIKTSKQKIVSIATNKAIISIAIFFYLVLFLIRAKEKNFGQAIVHGHKVITLLNAPAVAAVPVIAEGVTAAVGTGTGGAVAAGATEATAAGAAGAVGSTEAAGAVGAGEGVGAGLETAKATETGVNAAKTGMEAANAAKNAGTAEATASKPIATNGSALSGKDAPKLEEVGKRAPDIKDELGEFRKRYGQAKDVRNSVQSNKDQKEERMDQENNKGAENETVSGEGTNNLVKGKLSKVVLGFGLAAAMLLMAVMSYPLMVAQQVSPTSAVVEGVGSGGGGSTASLASIGSKIAAFFLKLKDAITGHGYYTKEEELYAKITAEYQKYYQQYGIEIDVPTISATLFYDVNSFGQTDNNNDGLPDIDHNYIDRTNNVETVTSFMLQKYETQFTCTQEGENDTATYKKVFVQTVPVDNNVNKSSTVCTSETVGQSIYEYNYEVNLDHYYQKLTTSDAGINVLKSIYGNNAETELQRRTLAAEIKGYRDNWVALYDELKDENCPSSGTITGDVLSQMASPVSEPYKITSYFGYRTGEFSGFHRGIDVVPTQVVNIYAAAEGTVTRVASGLTKEIEGGNIVEITHNFNGVKYVTQYAHLADNSILVSVGATVTKGQKIAVMGATGQVSGAHLHFQMWKYPYSQDNLINTVNLFEAASNYIYQCKNTNNEADCSLEGSVANIAQSKGYNFNIIRAIIQYESSSSSSNVLVLGFKPEDLKKRLDKINTPQAQNVAAQINFDDETVNINGAWQSFAGSTHQIERHQVVDLIGTVDTSVYDAIAMGIGQIKGSNHDAVGYATSKEMYEGLSKSKYAQVLAMVAYLEHQGNSVINVLKNIGNMTTDAELDQAVQTLVDAYRPGGETAWKEHVLANYKQFRDDPNSTIENYIKECSASVIIENPNWEICSTYENQGACNRNIKTYKNIADQLLAQVTDPTRRAILTNALSLWGYVRYCSYCDPSVKKCAETLQSTYVQRCKNSTSIYYYSKQGFNPDWKKLHSYTWTFGGETHYVRSAAISGLDCGGFVTWVYNQTLKTTMKYVLHTDGACRVNTEHTKYGTFPKNDLSVLQPGDGICHYDGNRHTMIYMGTINGKYYFIHTADGTEGVKITGWSASTLISKEYSYYFTINK